MNVMFFKYKYVGSTVTCLLACDYYDMSPSAKWIAFSKAVLL